MRASAKTSETNLWKWLRGARYAFQEALHINRVENSISDGMPDVEGCLQREQFWIELKCVARPARAETPLSIRFETGQVPWLETRTRAGGRAFVLVQVGSGHRAARYLVSGAIAHRLEEPLDEDVLGAISLVLPHVGPARLLLLACDLEEV